MWKAEKAWRQELSLISLAEIQQTGAQETPPEQIQKSITWFKESLT
jgi:hypothetical protein